MKNIKESFTRILNLLAPSNIQPIIVILLFPLIYGIIFAVSPLFAEVNDYLTITEQKGISSTNYPVQIGRPFLKGEIKHYPQAIINGQPVLTQADVKCRWDDGSVKHAIISFLIPELKANDKLKISFQDQLTGNNDDYPTATDMLSDSYNFDAQIELTNPDGTKTVSASARDMLQSGHFVYWTKGPIATTVILADHSVTRKFDLGFDSYRSFRPIFHATFWPALKKVRVRYIGEVANTEALQDMKYSLKLILGYNSPEAVYSKPLFTHYAATRWTKVYWIGSAPEEIIINHNLDYLKETKALPNYDTSKQIPESVIASEYNIWLKASKDLYDTGNWQKDMGSPGGRREIGPYPAWTVRWLYTGDVRMKKMAFGNADLAAAWPMHFREGNPDKYFDIKKTMPGVGKVISISDRPSLRLAVLDYKYTHPEDRVVPVGPVSNGGWKPDGAHQPDAFYPQYLLTGDYWYLEEMYFWASYSAASSNGAATAYPYGRGPTGAEGCSVGGQVRGKAWTFRNRAELAFIAPDDSPEKNYFTILTENTIAGWEGVHNITDTKFLGNACWDWGHSMIGQKYRGLGVPPLHHWERGSGIFVQQCMDSSVVKDATSPWEQNMLLYALGRAKELGYPTEPIIQWFAPHLINQITNPDYSPYLVATYRIPTVKLSDGKYFDTWAELKTGFKPDYDPIVAFHNNLYDTEHGYTYIALAATSMVANEPGGKAAWDWMVSHVLNSDRLNNNPKWAILPRWDNTNSHLVPSPPHLGIKN
ncbi:hypothetical protein [Desulfovulcanus sp.]